MINKDYSLTIKPATNGFIVTKGYKQYREDGGAFDYEYISEKTVFLDYASAVDFVKNNDPSKETTSST